MLNLKRLAVLGNVKRLPALAAEIVLPPTCPACRSAVTDGFALCARCWSAIRFIEPPLCPIYGTPFAYDLGEGIVSAEALADPPPFRRARAAAIYGDAARRLVHHVKYHDRPDLARVMATAMHRAGRPLLAECALIVPVPLYRWRLWQRRFNQAAELGAALSRLSGVPHDPFVLERRRSTRRQVGLTAAQREENVRGAFRVRETAGALIAAKPVLLVDDVYTSGATAKAATRALLRAGAASVDVLTFARVTHVN
jgi:ComF family protein